MKPYICNQPHKKGANQMLVAKDLSHSFGDKKVLSGCSFSLSQGERVGLVGPNGTGKSTLLKILTGILEPDMGTIKIVPHIKVGYLAQEILPENKGVSVVGFLASLSETSIDSVAADPRVLSSFGLLGLPVSLFEREIGTLSGGEKSKINLIRLVLSDCDVCLLDEPTNNLDLRGLLFLERLIRQSKSAFIIVSHDRKLLDDTVTRIIELDEWTHSIHIYEGGWTEYENEREARIVRQWEGYEDYQDAAQKLEDSARKKKEWAAKSSRGEKRPSDHEKMLRKGRRDWSSGIASAAKQLEKRRSELNPVNRPKDRLPMKFSLDVGERSGDIVFELAGIEKRLAGDIGIGPLDLSISYGEKVAIIGPNGVGKTTLLKLLIGQAKPTLGKLRIGSRLKIGYLPQVETLINDTAVQYLRVLTNLPVTDARKMLNRFGVGPEDALKPFLLLSPGQRSRVILAALKAKQANCLILDEPSNHLDTEALVELEQALRGYDGTLIVVTHDRYFLDQIKPTKTYLFECRDSLRAINDYNEYENSLSS